MNLRGRAPLHHPGIQLAPLVDVLLLLLIFFLLTWNAARTENELDVKVPKASAAKEKTAPIGDVIVNVNADGNVVVNRRTLTGPELQELLKSMVQLNPEQAVVIRGDEAGAYKNIIGVLNICTEAGVTNVAIAQSEPEVRRARPVDEPPVRRAVPADDSIDKVLRSLKDDVPESSSRETEGADQRQLEYANGLFARKLYDLAIPEYQKYLDDYPGRAGRANAYFSLGECYRNLHRDSNARTNLQKALTEYGDSEFAGPAAFALAEMAFTDKDYATALPLFHRSAAKSKEPAVALSARYFEARCLEALTRKDEAADLYAQVAEAGNPNPYREDARVTAASIFAARGKRLDALKQYEALANEGQKPVLKAECAVRGGLIALELVQADKGKMDKAMADRAAALFQKGRTLSDAGKFRAIAQVGFRRLQYQTG